MGAHEIFKHNQRIRSDFKKEEEEKVPSEAFEEYTNLEVEEILEEGIPSLPRHYTHYYVIVGDEPSIPPRESTLVEPNLSQPLSQFLRLPQIEVPMFTRVRNEPIVDYSQSQVLTSNENVEKLRRIADKKAMIEEEKATK